MFEFKQFSIEDDCSTMKVGTDAVLLGAMVEIDHKAQHILDIGTGCGVIALMMAQKFANAEIEAIDIDGDSIRQARENINGTMWKDRVKAIETSLQNYKGKGYDIIVSNPPYFENSLKAPNAQRNLARHTDTLPIEDLIGNVNRLLLDDGCFWGILPYPIAQKAIAIGKALGMECLKKYYIRNKENCEIKRIIFQLSKNKNSVQTLEQEYAIRDLNNAYSNWYRGKTESFYTHLK